MELFRCETCSVVCCKPPTKSVYDCPNCPKGVLVPLTLEVVKPLSVVSYNYSIPVTIKEQS